MGASAFLLGACRTWPGDPVCVLEPDQQSDATALVSDPTVGEHTGKLVWLETGATTDFTLTLDFDGPAIKASEDCPGPYQVAVRSQAVSADGLIDESRTQNEFVTAAHGLSYESIGFGLDAASLLAAGVAPDQPKLAEQGPSISLEVSRDASGWTGGSVRAVTADQSVTLAVIDFAGGS